MNRTTGLIIAFCLGGFSAALAWLTGAPAATARRAHIQALRSVPAAPALVASEVLLSKLERQLTGAAAPDSGPWTGEAFDRMVQTAWGTLEGKIDLREYVEGWVRHKPAAVFAWLQSHRNVPSIGRFSDSYNYSVSMLMRAWAETDMESAIAAALKFSNPVTRAQALLSSLQALWKLDPVRARTIYEQNHALFTAEGDLVVSVEGGEANRKNLGFLKSLPPGKGRAKLLTTLLEDIAATSSPSAAVAFWDTAPPELKRELVAAGFSNTSRYWMSSHYTQNVLKSLAGVEDLQREWAGSTGDPGDAKTFLLSHGNDWASRDLPAALAWTQAHVPGKEGMVHTVRLFYHAAGKNLDTTVKTWHSLPSGVLKARAAGNIVRGAPAERKLEAEALITTFSPSLQTIARKEGHRPM